jgi:hypothetical protein
VTYGRIGPRKPASPSTRRDGDSAEQDEAIRPTPGRLNQDNMVALQQTIGNFAVQRLVSRAQSAPTSRQITVQSDKSFVATIRRPEDSDAEPGNDVTDPVDPAAVGDALAGAAPVPADAAEGETVALPDITVPDALEVAETDAVASGLTYAGSIAQSGAVSPFGATSWASFTLTGITVTAASGTYTVRATLQNPITFNVASGGRTNIASDADAALTAANYATAASDLTPNMSDLNGRPPRTQFWAEDLTIRHERFHANERFGFAQSGLTAVQAWLNTQTAGSVADVQSLLNQVPGRVIASSQAAMPFPAKEERAYGDGVPLYKARADSIKTKGAAGTYP